MLTLAGCHNAHDKSLNRSFNENFFVFVLLFFLPLPLFLFFSHVFSLRVVEFASLKDMKTAIEKLDDTELNGRRIRLVEDSRQKGRRGRSRSSSNSRSRSRSRRRSR
jgi:hypothetical protein